MDIKLQFMISNIIWRWLEITYWTPKMGYRYPKKNYGYQK